MMLICLPTLAVMHPPVSTANDFLDWSLCHVQYTEPEDLPAMPPPELRGQTLLSADHARATGREILTLQGDVEAIRDGQLLRSDVAVYDQRRDLLQAEGNVRYLREGFEIKGDHGELFLEADRGYMENPSFLLYERHGRGHAERATFEDRETTVLTRMSYTTCDPGNEDWLLRSGRLRLNQGTGIGTARNVTLSFKGVPFLYSPYLSFPIDDQRKSGFLSPTIRDSSRSGIDFATPYYLNLAPRYDATLTPRIITRRGEMLETEFRYLTRTGTGRVNTSWLPDDDLIERDRYLFHYRHFGRPTERLNLDIEFNRVSDSDYHRDLGGNLSIASITHLEQRALLNYQADTWMASARLQAWQTIDDTIAANRRPYRQLPALLFRSQQPEYSHRINPRFISSYVNFDHHDLLNGGRLELQPGLSLPFYSMAAYAHPTLMLRHTRYHLDESIGTAGRDPQRTMPVFTLDTGVFFERDTRWGDQPMLQTLEPRLYYLYVPYRDQSQLPLFDSGLPDFNFTQLFRDNRFSGSDRIGDANQVSLGITSRFLNAETGRQRAQLGIGQIWYFQDREVTLRPQDPIETASTSDIVAEGTANLTPSISMRFDARISEENGEFDRGGVQFQYRPAPRNIINVGYRYRDSSLEQTDVSMLWPLTPRWHLIARHNYSLRDEQILETLAGLEYQSCCWRIRVASRRYVHDDDGNIDRSIYVQFDLKGLTGIGTSLESLLEHGILGYRY